MDIRTYPVTPVTLDALRAENERLRNELDAMTSHWRNSESELADAKRELKAHRDERPRLLRANVRLFHDANALRAELDAMRETHSVIVGRMEAMGC